MYSWGGDTSSWKKPGGYKYDSARAPYMDSLASASKAKGGRKYSTRSSPDPKFVDPKKTIETNSLNAIVFGIDVTGSMSEWPKEIFDRLPLFYQTLSQYRPDLEVSFGAIGDANSDQYPLQVNNFGKGVALEDHINALFPEGGGGGQTSESYELFGYFALAHVKMPKAVSPFLFICGDEKFYNKIQPDQVEFYMGDKLNAALDTKTVLNKLMQKYDLFYLSKPYGDGDDNATTKAVRKHWADAIGEERMIKLPSYDRVVDIAMGIVAKKWGQFGDYKTNLGARQTDPNVVSKVYTSIDNIPELGGSRTKPLGTTPPLKQLPPG
jgi:hypothetical protein